MYPSILSFIENLDYSLISEERKFLLGELAASIQDKQNHNKRINLIGVCTHNSRRSHLCQIWSKIAGAYYRIRKTNSYSGGTEVTAVKDQIIKTLSSQGFDIYPLSDGDNPVYALRYDEVSPPIHLFSKKYDDPYNPSKEFIALMNCDHADQNCPIVHGAESRYKISYVDPKRSDGSDEQAQIYLETSEIIAREMFYLFSLIKK